MYGFLIAVTILVCFLLMIVILMQSSKGTGLAGSLGGGSVGTVFGVRRTADFLSRATTGLATVFIVLCLIINMFFLPGRTETEESVIQRSATPTSVPRPAAPRASQPAASPEQQQEPPEEQ